MSPIPGPLRRSHAASGRHGSCARTDVTSAIRHPRPTRARRCRFMCQHHAIEPTRRATQQVRIVASKRVVAATVRVPISRPDLLERGDIFFFYRPAHAGPTPGSLLDVNRFHIVLRPEGGERLRYLTVGKKRLPARRAGPPQLGIRGRRVRGPGGAARRAAGRGRRSGHQPRRQPARRPCRPARASTRLVRRGRNTRARLCARAPRAARRSPARVQHRPPRPSDRDHQEPRVPSPEGIGLDEERKAPSPRNSRSASAPASGSAPTRPPFLDHEGAEFLLIAGDDPAEDLGVDLAPESEDESTADVFRELHLEPSDRTIKPLFEGTWS